MNPDELDDVLRLLLFVAALIIALSIIEGCIYLFEFLVGVIIERRRRREDKHRAERVIVGPWATAHKYGPARRLSRRRHP